MEKSGVAGGKKARKMSGRQEIWKPRGAEREDREREDREDEEEER